MKDFETHSRPKCRGRLIYQRLKSPITGKFEAASSEIFQCDCGSRHFHIRSDLSLICVDCGGCAGHNTVGISQ